MTLDPASTVEDQALQADIAALRGRFTDTRELYREVCALLFFRYGVTPTANKLYSLVRKGRGLLVFSAISDGTKS